MAVSEGIADKDGQPIAAKLAVEQGHRVERDSHGNVQLSGTGALGDFLGVAIKDRLGIKRVRSDTFGYLQRSFAGLQSPVDAAEARRCGQEAVRFAMQTSSGSVAMKRTGNGARYGVEYFRTDLANVAEKTKSLAPEHINADGNGITPAFVKYAMPLTGGLPKTVYLGNYPLVK